MTSGARLASESSESRRESIYALQHQGLPRVGASYRPGRDPSALHYGRHGSDSRAAASLAFLDGKTFDAKTCASAQDQLERATARGLRVESGRDAPTEE